MGWVEREIWSKGIGGLKENKIRNSNNNKKTKSEVKFNNNNKNNV